MNTHEIWYWSTCGTIEVQYKEFAATSREDALSQLRQYLEVEGCGHLNMRYRLYDMAGIDGDVWTKKV